MEWIIVIGALFVVGGAVVAFLHFILAPILAKENYNMWRGLAIPFLSLPMLMLFGLIFFNADLEPFWNRVFGGTYWQDVVRAVLRVSRDILGTWFYW